MTKLKTILLIDDDPATNFLHKLVIEEWGKVEHVEVCDGARKALDYLGTKIDGGYPQPDMIFVDINMPGMSGWDFLEVYEKLPAEQQCRVVVMMLTTSMNPDDRARAKQYGLVDGFMNKPLEESHLEDLLAQNFS